ncbi:MAG: ATP-grasp domain-containing protein [Actinomycetia bacterium]|nr:ATP-grasp domain-containing protein [Actinomycetes bacterium]
MAQTGNADFVPLIFASDINVYSVARAFHEQYGIVSAAIGKVVSGPVRYSSIVDYRPHPQADSAAVLPRLVRDFAAAHSEQRVIVLGCGDNYVRQISIAKPDFPENVVAPYLDIDELDRLANKEHFYRLCEQAGVVYPRSFICSGPLDDHLQLEFDAPYVVKPANSVSWWQHPFKGQRKVHLVQMPDDLKALLSAIYAAGYPDTMIIQEYIGGGDAALRVLTQYFDQNGVLRLSCAGQVLLEEHTAHGIGNSTVILSEPHPALAQQLAALLQNVGYRGFAAFDVKFDHRDQCFKVLEVNTRQGRGNYYVTAAGINIARHLAEDVVYGKGLDPELEGRRACWSLLPHRVLLEAAATAGLKDDVQALKDAGQVISPLVYAADKNLMRSFWIWKYTKRLTRNYDEWQRELADA